jgi:hypothetical protein
MTHDLAANKQNAIDTVDLALRQGDKIQLTHHQAMRSKR